MRILVATPRPRMRVEIGADDVPSRLLLNKIDRVSEAQPSQITVRGGRLRLGPAAIDQNGTRTEAWARARRMIGCGETPSGGANRTTNYMS